MQGGTSFYGPRGALALPRVADWLEELRRATMLPDMRGVRVYHLALGMPEPARRGEHQPSMSFAQAARLKALWQAYWGATGANVSFGEPLFSQGLGG